MHEREDRKVLTEFGAVVLSLALARGIRHQAELAARLENLQQPERPVRKQSLSAWLRGLHAPPSWLPQAITDALALDEVEQVKLAKGFSFGYDRKVQAFQL